MKQLRIFIITTIMLMMGSVCLAQEAKKDSIWGLEVEFNNNSIQMSYYWDFSNNGLENTFAFKVTFRYNDKVQSTYIQYEKDELWGKMFENCKIDTISDSVWKITIYDLIPDFSSFKIQDITKISLEGDYNCNVNTIEFIPQRLPVSGQIDGYDYIDLGLPSGLKWATYNVGATKLTEKGDYFAWGETAPKESYNGDSYKWYTKDSLKKFHPTKYIATENDGTADKKLELDAEDDAATVNWSNAWRMPSSNEIEELYDGCVWEKTSNYNESGIAGIIGTSKVNGKTIFFPAAGYRDGKYTYAKDHIYYWSSSLNPQESTQAYHFCERGLELGIGIGRSDGQCVRAVVKNETFVVSFYTKDSVLIESQNVEKGKAAREVTAPTLDGYVFSGWDKATSKITADLKVYAQYKEIIVATVSGQVEGIDYVDLGLPSGIKWATYNLGATQPNESGDYFAWGETTPKENYSWSNYKWCTVDADGMVEKLTKYVTSNTVGTIDSLSTLERDDDAASANWGNLWRMPTYKEIKELYDGCYWEWTDNYAYTGVAGRIGTSIVNGNRIFLPAGNYFSSELDNSYNESAYALTSDKKHFNCTELVRYYQEKVRAVSGSRVFKVIFSGMGDFYETQYVEEGKSAAPVKVPYARGFEFIGWKDSSFVNVTKDLVIYAKYKEVPVSNDPTISGVIGKHSYVDLGLPSGIKWATYNVGATKPTEVGDYFAWGETKAKTDYSLETYKWCNGHFYDLTKYCTEKTYGTVDNKEILEEIDDAASANWGIDWRMPTFNECIELVNYCKWEWISDYNGSNVSGYLGRSKSNDAIIFLPCTGRYNNKGLSESDTYGYYWASEMAGTYESYEFYFYKDFIKYWSDDRSLGQCVRAVTTKEPTGVSLIVNDDLHVYTVHGTIFVTNSQPHNSIKVSDMNGKTIVSSVTDGDGNAEVSVSKGVYVVTDGQQSTKVVIK